jgi:hypothetical protein
VEDAADADVTELVVVKAVEVLVMVVATAFL